MKHTEIEGIIDDLNDGPSCNIIFKRKITETVEFSKIWPKDAIESSDLFLIKTEQSQYIGAVFIMNNGGNLHAFIKQEHRRKKNLTKAFTEAIVPYFVSQGVEALHASFEDPDEGGRCAKSLGFSYVSDSTATLVIPRKSITNLPTPEIQHCSRSDFEEMKSRVTKAKLQLKILKDQLDIFYPDCKNNPMSDEISKLHDVIDVMRDYIESKQGKLER
jgi:hypothetical protein